MVFVCTVLILSIVKGIYDSTPAYFLSILFILISINFYHVRWKSKYSFIKINGIFEGSLIKMQLYLHFQFLVFSIIRFEIMRILCINKDLDRLPVQFPLLMFSCLTL